MRTTTQKAAMVFGVVFLLVGLLGLFIPGGMEMQANHSNPVAPSCLACSP